MTDAQDNDDGLKRGEGFPQILHDRSRSTGQELHKQLLTLSTGTLAVYFFALTTEVNPPLTAAQKAILMLSLASMAIAAFSGILDLFADMRRNFFWASAIQATGDRPTRNRLYRQRDKWLAVERGCARSLLASFSLGILSSLIYLMLRVLEV